MRLVVVLVSVFSVTALTPFAFADHGEAGFTASGHLAVGNPTNPFLGSLAELEVADGVDGQRIDLPPWAPGHPLWVNGTSASPYDLDVWFYDATGRYLGSTDCSDSDADEACLVPAAGVVAFVDLFLGADVDFALTVRSSTGLPPPPEPEVGYTIPMFGPFTWDHGDLSVVIVPSTLGAAYDQDLAARPEGSGVLTEASYVQATQDAMVAWEAAISAYIADHPEAAHLAAFDLDVRVVGRDATLADAEAADVTIHFSPAVPLGIGVLGVAIATETDEDGRFIHCDIINADWFLFSYTAADMYNIHAQEFGHCLGLGHPEDPSDDIMNGAYDLSPGDPANPRMCHSSLDVRGLEVAYGWMATTGVWAPSPEEIAQAPGEYVRYPPVGATNACTYE